MTPNILYISYDGMTDPLGQSQVLPYICGLSKLGNKFTLISTEKPEKYFQLKDTIQKICSDNNIDWKPICYTKKPPVLSTIWDINKIKKKAYRLHSKKHFDIVHCRGYISALIGLNLKQKFNIKFLFDMRGLWADEKVDAKAWNLKNPVYNYIYNYFKKKERSFFEQADYTVSLTQKGKNEIQSWESIANNPIKIDVIPCCVDTNLFNPDTLDIAKIQLYRNSLSISSYQYVLSYLGSIGTWYMLDEMMDFFEELLKYKSNAIFLYITHDEHDRIRNEASKRNILQNIRIYAAQRTEVPAIASISDVSVFFIRPTYSKLSSSPTKQGELMALGVPIVCNANVGDTVEIVNKYQAGVVNKGFDKENYIKAIDLMLNSQFDKNNMRAGSIEYFSLEKGILKYQSVYEKIMS